MVLKEFRQLRRDRVSFGLVVGLPIAQLLLFGYAINSDPKNLPTGIVGADQSEFTRKIISDLRNTGYFEIGPAFQSEEEARRSLAVGEKLYVINFPTDFTKRLLRGERPSVLVEIDGSDPAAGGQALLALGQTPRLSRELRGPLAHLRDGSPPYQIRAHRLYNPEGLTRYNIIPGLMGVILTITMVMMTSLAITRERERGSMENLLSMPLSPLEVMAGKIFPYIFIGFIQITLIVAASLFLFRVPLSGGLASVYLAAIIFVTANLAVGVAISSWARSQLQAVQLTIFYFMPSMILSGFMFPVLGQPKWAQVISGLFPLTHFNRLIRAIFLKGNAWGDLWPHTWPILLFTLAVMTLAVKTYRRTLD